MAEERKPKYLNSYNTVTDRIRLFREEFPEGLIKTEILSSLEQVGEYVLFVARVWKERKFENYSPDAVGHSLSFRGSVLVDEYLWSKEKNKMDKTGNKIPKSQADVATWVENCETSAVGRALAFLRYPATDEDAATITEDATKKASSIDNFFDEPLVKKAEQTAPKVSAAPIVKQSFNTDPKPNQVKIEEHLKNK